MNEKRWKTLVKKTLFYRLDTDGDLGVFVFQTCFNFVTGVKDRSMIFASEKLSDLRIGHVQFRSAKEHADLSGNEDLFASFIRHDVAYGDVICTRNDLDNDLRCDLLGLLRGDHILKSYLCIIQSKGICQETVSDYCFKSTVEAKFDAM